MSDAVMLSSRLVALSVALQSLELLALARAFDRDGPLPYVGMRGMRLLAGLQLALCILLLWLGASPLLLGVLVTYVLAIARFGAPFNGGSDVLSCLSLGALGLAALAPEGSLLTRAAPAYLAVQVVLSYFIAGLAKLKQPGWRNGRALVHFARLPKYGVPAWARGTLAKPGRARSLSWSVLLFECSFPLGLLSPRACLVYLTLGAGFHAANALLFGLNRFFFSWLALYPMVWALSAF